MKNKKILRRLQSICLSLLLILSMFSAMPVHAAGITEVIFGEVTAKVGDEVIVPVSVKNNPGIASFRFRVSYDTDVFEFISATEGSLLTLGTLSSTTNADAKTMTFQWFAEENIYGDGEFVQLKFKVLKSDIGDHSFNVTYLENDIVNDNLESIPFEVNNVKIIIICTSHTYDNDCDTECNVCHETRTINHTYDGDCDTECNICHETRTAPHRYSSNFDTKCDGCGFIRTVTDTSCYTYTVSDGKATITDVDTSISGDIIIPSTLGGYSVTSIGSYAFRDCTGLTSITIPDSVTTIGAGAFQGCNGLTKMTLPFIGGGTKSNPSLGYIFGASNYIDNLSFVPSSLKTIIISDNCTRIWNHAFFYCKGLENISIGNGVISIGGYAFQECTGLVNITIPDSVTTIGINAFTYCSGLTNITIGQSVSSIESEAFLGCTGLTNISIPNSVTRISSRVFYDCTGLTNLIIGTGIEEIHYSAFENCTALTNVAIISTNKIDIGSEIFKGCAQLTDIWYAGSESDVYITWPNTVLKNATWHYNTCVNEHTYSGSCDSDCDKCDWSRTVSSNHTYTSTCDTICNVCCAIRSTSISHTYDNSCDAECNICYETRTITHTYDGDCDRECNICHTTRTTNIEHTYSNENDLICNVCSEERAIGGHIYDNDSDMICNGCGYDRSVPNKVTSDTLTVTDNTISKIVAGTTVETFLSNLGESQYCKVYKGNTEVASDTKIGTGMKVKIMDGDTVKAEYTVIVTGDTNGDGNISVTDMISIKAHVLGSSTLTNEYAKAADTSGDGGISVTDFIQIKAKILGVGTITAR